MIDFMCFLFDFDFVKNLLTNEVFIGYFGIVIEAIFLFFVVKEFKMTRKSFEWQQKEQEEKKDKEILKKIRIIMLLVLNTLSDVLHATYNDNKLSKEEIFNIIDNMKKTSTRFQEIPDTIYMFIKSQFFQGDKYSYKDVVNFSEVLRGNDNKYDNAFNISILDIPLVLEKLKKKINNDEQIEHIYDNITPYGKISYV